MSLIQILPLTVFSDVLSLSDVYLSRYNDQQHAQEALQSPCTTNITVSLSF